MGTPLAELKKNWEIVKNLLLQKNKSITSKILINSFRND
jgi:hypothetical protein